MSNAIYQIVQGDTVAIPCLMKRDGAVEVVSDGSTVKACLVADGVAYGQITCLSTDIRANWPSGIVGVVWNTATSATFPIGDATIEVEVNGETWFNHCCQVVAKHIV